MSLLLVQPLPRRTCRQDRPAKTPEALLSREELLSPMDPVERLFTPDQWREVGSALDLSDRELAVTMLLTQGVSRRAIALALRKADGSTLSTDTVRVYIDRVFRKARVSDRQGLTLRLARVYLLLHGIGRCGAAGGDAAGSGS